MGAEIRAIYRYPVKGFTPEALSHVDLAVDEPFPFDRLWAVENGPSGFDPAAPVFIPKQKFTVLAALPRVAAARTRYDEASGLWRAQADGLAPFEGSLDSAEGLEGFAAWLTELLGEELRGPLKVLRAPQAFRFTDNPRAQVSIVNLASVRDLERRTGWEIDPLRFRANLYVDGWAPWAEMDWVDQAVSLGSGEAAIFKPTVRCAAIHVHPREAVRDLDLTRALFDNYGHMFCGVYLRMTKAGRIAVGDAVGTPGAASPSIETEEP